MATLWIVLLVVVTYVVTISIVVVGQELHPLVAVFAFAVTIFAALRLFKSRMTRF